MPNSRWMEPSGAVVIREYACVSDISLRRKGKDGAASNKICAG